MKKQQLAKIIYLLLVTSLTTHTSQKNSLYVNETFDIHSDDADLLLFDSNHYKENQENHTYAYSYSNNTPSLSNIHNTKNPQNLKKVEKLKKTFLDEAQEEIQANYHNSTSLFSHREAKYRKDFKVILTLIMSNNARNDLDTYDEYVINQKLRKIIRTYEQKINWYYQELENKQFPSCKEYRELTERDIAEYTTRTTTFIQELIATQTTAFEKNITKHFFQKSARNGAEYLQSLTNRESIEEYLSGY